MSMNHIVLMGTVIRGPEYRMTPNGVPTANLTVAVPRPPRGESQAEISDYIRVVTWRNLAEKINEAVQKGDTVAVEGRLTTRSWETQDGQRRKTVEVEASTVETVKTGAGARQAAASDYPDEEPDFGDFESAPAPAPAARKPAARPAAPPADLDDEIPF